MLDHALAGMPDHDPCRTWANFEFASRDGAIDEVNLLVLTKHGLWLVEIKGRPSRAEGTLAPGPGRSTRPRDSGQ